MAMTGDIERRVESLEEIAKYHEARLNALQSIAEKLPPLLERMDARLERLERMEAGLEEIRRDAAQAQRLWVRLAQRYGWLDAEDLGA